MRSLFLAIPLTALTLLVLLTVAARAGPCEDAGACTLPSGECGAECGGTCLPFAEAACCMSGQCFLNGSWCGGVECNGVCLPPDEAACCMSGCTWVSGSCKCATPP